MPEGVADRRAGRRSAALAQDAPLAGEGDDVVDDDEVAGEVLLGDRRAARARAARGPRPRGGRRRSARRSHARPAPAATSRRCGPRGSAAWAARGRPCAGRRPARRPARRCGRRRSGYAASAAAVSAPLRRWAEPDRSSQPSRSARLRRARTAAIAEASRCRCGVAWWTLPAATTSRPWTAASRASDALVASAPGRGDSSTRTCSSPNSEVSRSSASAAAGSPPLASACRTAPLRHPVSTAQWPRPRSPSSSRS